MIIVEIFIGILLYSIGVITGVYVGYAMRGQFENRTKNNAKGAGYKNRK